MVDRPQVDHSHVLSALPEELLAACRVAIRGRQQFRAMMGHLRALQPDQGPRIDRILAEVEALVEETVLDDDGLTVGELLSAVELKDLLAN